jgi:hypothetical protein
MLVEIYVKNIDVRKDLAITGTTHLTFQASPSPVGAVPGWLGEGSGGNPGNGREKEEWKDKIVAII